MIELAATDIATALTLASLGFLLGFFPFFLARTAHENLSPRWGQVALLLAIPTVPLGVVWILSILP